MLLRIKAFLVWIQSRQRQLLEDAKARVEIYFYLQTILAVSPSSCSWLFFLFYVASGGGVEALGDGEQGAQKFIVQGGAGRYFSTHD